MHADPLYELLLDLQGAMSDRRFAAELGLSEKHWWLIRTGRRPLSPFVTLKALRRYPELAAFLSEPCVAS